MTEALGGIILATTVSLVTARPKRQVCVKTAPKKPLKQTQFGLATELDKHNQPVIILTNVLQIN